MIISKNNPWSQLHSVMLGNYYYPEYFAWIPQQEIREPLMRVAHDIHQDLDAFEQQLRAFGCEVIRPGLMSVDQFREAYDVQHSLPNAPLQPRNTHVVVYDTMYSVSPSSEVCEALPSVQFQDITQQCHGIFQDSMQQHHDCFNTAQGIWYSKQKYHELAGPDWPDFCQYVQGQRGNVSAVRKELQSYQSSLRYNSRDWLPLQPPNVIPLPDRLILDTNEYADYSEIFRSRYPGVAIEHINTGAGHTDGCFVILGKKTIIGIDPLINYEKHFPGYTVIPVPANAYGDIIQQHKVSAGQKPDWWLPDHGNQALAKFVDRYMKAYTGSVWETLFDVNVLCINENTVCVTNPDAAISAALRQRGIDTVMVPWRHRFFVDGGLHCITLDLCRDKI